jgi:phage repressor protein C with HTH and peptisase S24 domain
VINVRGDSMADTIEPGDLIFVDISVNELMVMGLCLWF